MLVLSRKVGEKIVIGDNITVTLVHVDRNKVRLGVECPRDVPVDRMEVHLQKLAARGEPKKEN